MCIDSVSYPDEPTLEAFNAVHYMYQLKSYYDQCGQNFTKRRILTQFARLTSSDAWAESRDTAEFREAVGRVRELPVAV